MKEKLSRRGSIPFILHPSSLLFTVRIKVCGINNLEDALAAVEAGADMLGFNFYCESPRYIKPSRARDIIECLPENVLSVGVFVNERPETVLSIADEAGLGGLQLHGDETPEDCRAVAGRFLIKALRVGEGFTPESAAAYPSDAVLLDAFDRGARGGTGRTFDWRLARRTRELVPQLFLAGGLSPANVEEAIAAVAPYGVDACSGLECAPGRKDHALVRDFIARARRAC
ncbi:MAG TPA: phosphoribosylanthranilate isomerase [Pyrinomonadaceae bacterium]|jgi:phosphoribosylanthranilate isomerase